MVATAPNLATIDPSSHAKNKLSSRLRGAFSQGLSPTLNNFTQPVAGSPALSEPVINTSQALDTLDQVISQVEATGVAQQIEVNDQQPVISEGDLNDQSNDLGPLPQATVQAALSQTDTLNPVTPARIAKETIEVKTTNPLETASANQQAIEVEKAKEMEIPVEVEAYVQKVVDSKDQLPEEIVVADDNANLTPKDYPKMPVVVLPLTPQQDEEGQKKPASYSLRWLVELSHKLMKIFSGAVIYREEE